MPIELRQHPVIEQIYQNLIVQLLNDHQTCCVALHQLGVWEDRDSVTNETLANLDIKNIVQDTKNRVNKVEVGNSSKHGVWSIPNFDSTETKQAFLIISEVSSEWEPTLQGQIFLLLVNLAQEQLEDDTLTRLKLMSELEEINEAIGRFRHDPVSPFNSVLLAPHLYRKRKKYNNEQITTEEETILVNFSDTCNEFLKILKSTNETHPESTINQGFVNQQAARLSRTAGEAVAKIEELITYMKNHPTIFEQVRIDAAKQTIDKIHTSIQRDFKPEFINPVDAVRHIRQPLIHLHPSVNIQLTYDTSSSQLIEVDLKALDSIISNLVSNAIEAGKNSRSQTRITINISRTDSDLTLSVTDNGPGIKAANINKVFEKNFTTKQFGKPEDHGQGLHIVTRFVQLHGGSITASNNEGPGATFTVTMPLTQASRYNK